MDARAGQRWAAGWGGERRRERRQEQGGAATPMPAAAERCVHACGVIADLVDSADESTCGPPCCREMAPAAW